MVVKPHQSRSFAAFPLPPGQAFSPASALNKRLVEMLHLQVRHQEVFLALLHWGITSKLIHTHLVIDIDMDQPTGTML